MFILNRIISIGALLPVLSGAVSCGHFYHPMFVEFDNASEVCRESRELVAIESKMIPSDDVLRAKAKGNTFEGSALLAETGGDAADMLINEDDEERFITIPNSRFAAVTLPNGKRLVYWIHFVSSDEATLDEVEKEQALHYRKIDAVLSRFQQDGKLKTPGWEKELNSTLLWEIQRISKFRRVSRVFIHLGC